MSPLGAIVTSPMVASANCETTCASVKVLASPVFKVEEESLSSNIKTPGPLPPEAPNVP